MKVAARVFSVVLTGFQMVGAVAVGSDAIKEEKVTFEGVKYRVVRLSAERLKLVWKGKDGNPMRSFDQVQDYYQKQGERCVFLMNAGIYEPGGIPSGLHIQDGKQLLPLNTKNGWGNFYLKPNGIFCIIKGWRGGAHVMSTNDYSAYLKQRQRMHPYSAPVLAIQSGPLLVSGGKVHPKFRPNSDSKLYRNGVGVDDKGRIVFAITAKGQEVNLHGFARLFLHFGCKNALFLDGDISRMELNPAEKLPSHAFGAIFTVTEPLSEDP
ncbi:hypothetical protein NT6N_39910 [Oceaniferula spumae]|uniref:Phosphodiester glycosidase domain-containing protein n=1 Tax=Oceaniferula spumae TaxID=2979115 RepID=A0AAT9FSF5_9BACT